MPPGNWRMASPVSSHCAPYRPVTVRISAVTRSGIPKNHIMMSRTWVPRSPKAPHPAMDGSAIQRHWVSNHPPRDPQWQLVIRTRLMVPKAPFRI